MSLNDLRADQKKVAKKIVDLQESLESDGRAWDSEEQEKFDRLAERFDELDAEAGAEEERAEKVATYKEWLEEDQEELDKHKSFGAPRMSAEDVEERKTELFRQALTLHPQEPMEKVYRAYREDAELRTIGTQVTGTSGYGGVLVPRKFQTELIEGMKSFGGLQRSRATRKTYPKGGTHRWPLIYDSTNMAQIIGEATAPSTSYRVDFHHLDLSDLKLRVGPIKISREMRQDGELNVEQIVRDACSLRFARAFEDGMVNSTAVTTSSTGFGGLYSCSSNANGLSTATVFAKGSSNITAETLVSAIDAVDPLYSQNGEWMFNQKTMSGIRKVRWGSSEPFIWEPSVQDGTPSRLLGYPYIVNNSMSTGKFGYGSSDLYPIWFGDWAAGYYYKLILPPTIKVLTERYADEDVVGVIGFMRAGSRPVSSDIGQFPLAAVRTT